MSGIARFRETKKDRGQKSDVGGQGPEFMRFHQARRAQRQGTADGPDGTDLSQEDAEDTEITRKADPSPSPSYGEEFCRVPKPESAAIRDQKPWPDGNVVV